MKATVLFVAIFIQAGMTGWAQENAPPSESSSQQPSKRPTLGPAPAPSLHGPKTSTTTDPRRLARVRKIYIERMDNALDQKLIEGLGKTRRFQLVGDRKHADAVLRGTCFDSRRLKLLRTEVYLNEVGGASIWLDSIRRPINPPSIEVAVDETATMILAHLTDSMLEAERH